MKTIKEGSRGNNVKRWQHFLLSKKYRSVGKPDGFFGNRTIRVTKNFQKRNRLKADGIVGPNTWRLVPKNFMPELIEKEVSVITPNKDVIVTPTSTNKWPKQDYLSMVNFYGPVGENQTSLELPYKMKLAWSKSTTVKKITCNEEVTKSLYTIFENTLKTYGQKDIEKLGLDLFGGCLNVRKMRGGSSWSIHSWGAAIDLDPDRNQLKWSKDRAVFAKKEYDDFWKIVEKEGWVSLGRSRNYDWMHFQAATL